MRWSTAVTGFRPRYTLVNSVTVRAAANPLRSLRIASHGPPSTVTDLQPTPLPRGCSTRPGVRRFALQTDNRGRKSRHPEVEWTGIATALRPQNGPLLRDATQAAMTAYQRRRDVRVELRRHSQPHWRAADLGGRWTLALRRSEPSRYKWGWGSVAVIRRTGKRTALQHYCVSIPPFLQITLRRPEGDPVTIPFCRDFCGLRSDRGGCTRGDPQVALHVHVGGRDTFAMVWSGLEGDLGNPCRQEPGSHE